MFDGPCRIAGRAAALTLGLTLVGSGLLAAQDGQAVRRGQAVSGTLTPSSEHDYTLQLDADQFVFGEVDQLTVDVVVQVFDPEGEMIREVDGPARGPETFMFESEVAGLHVIRVLPFEEGEGDYTLLLRKVERVAQDPDDRVDQLVTAYSGGDTPGVVVAVMEGGDLEFVRGYGMANLENGVEFDERTISNIGSVTKQFTAMSILLLEQDGELSLDDDIREHIPELPDFGHTVTLRNMLNHVTGYREFYNLLPMAGTQGEDWLTRDMAIRIVQNQPDLQALPDSEFNYNNTGYILLGMVVERVSGMDFPDFMRTRIFEPLGMNRTQLQAVQGTVIPGSAMGYSPVEGGGWRRARDLPASMGAGGIYTSAQDMALWMRNYRDGTVGGMEAIEAITTRNVLVDGDTTSYGLGMGVGTMRGRTVFQHTGGDTAHRTYFAYFPEFDGGVWVSSSNATFSTGIGGQIARLFFENHMDPPEDEADEAEEEGTTATMSEARMEAVAGDWLLEAQGQRIGVEFSYEDGSVFIQVTGQNRIRMSPVSDTSLEVQSVNAVVHWEFDADGSTDSATLVQGASMPLTRVEAEEKTADDLAQYAGTYFSRELETFYHLRMEDGMLMAHHRTLDPFEVRHQQGEMFAGAWFFSSMEFQRAGNGTVTGFVAGNGRTKGVVFRKQ